MDKLSWDKFAPQFHPSWERKMRPFIESDECANIYSQIRALSARGKRIVPHPTQTFRAFLETNMDELKCMIAGFSPYHTLKDGKIIADGIALSAMNTMHLPPSLEQFYGAMGRELFPEAEHGIVQNPDLAYLCQQGIFMFNISMTCELGKAGSHVKIWEPFTKYVLEEVITISGIPIIWLGQDAARADKWVNPFQWRFKVSHPASAAYSQSTWDSEGVFKKVNQVMWEHNKYTAAWSEPLPF